MDKNKKYMKNQMIKINEKVQSMLILKLTISLLKNHRFLNIKGLTTKIILTMIQFLIRIDRINNQLLKQ
jgi:hypothetical protein